MHDADNSATAGNPSMLLRNIIRYCHSESDTPNQGSEAKRLPHPDESPDRAPSDFFLFGYLKAKLTAFHCTTQDELTSAIITIFNEIDRETFFGSL
jgi:hypothetical protein